MTQDIDKKEKSRYFKPPIFAVAPMIDWTDRHCRSFHRILTRRALLYTEMVTTGAILFGPRERLLGFSPLERPVAMQLGGSDPMQLAECAAIAAAHGYDEINLNVGCPSDRVQNGRFGACLMLEPALVGACVAAMKRAVPLPVTVKCRIGVDEQDPEMALDALADAVWAAGADALWVHARKAWLEGLSPKENRDIPPLEYDRVYRLKLKNPAKFIGINGGIQNLEEARLHLSHVDGVMLGRAAYHMPGLLAEADAEIFGDVPRATDWAALIATMADYAGRHIASGGRLSHVTRHMVGLFHGMPGARRWRQILSTDATKHGAGPEVLHAAFAAIDFNPADKAA